MATMNLAEWLAGPIVWRPALDPLKIMAAWAVLSLLAVVVYARTFRGRRMVSAGLLAMRLAAIAMIAGLLMGPSRVPPGDQQIGRGNLTVLLDTSGSMLTDDCGQVSRLEHAITHWLGPETLAEARRNFDLRLMGFDETVRTLTSDALGAAPQQLAAGRSTDYIQALRTALLDSATGSHRAIVVIGDGHDSEDRPMSGVISLARQHGVAIHAIAVGSSQAQRDLVLVAVPRQEYLMAGEAGQIAVSVYQTLPTQSVTSLHLRGPGVEETRPIRFDDRGAVNVELPIPAHEPGIYEYVVSVDPLDGERVTVNNSQSVFVEVTAKRIRVLLLEGEPYWDTKFLAQALRGDSRIELSAAMQVAPGRPQTIVTRADQQALAMPRTVEQFGQYDVVILGRSIEKLLTPDAAQALAQYVAAGGGHVVLARGRPYDPDTPAGRELQRPLAVLEPVVWSKGLHAIAEQSSVALTAEGLGHPAFAFAGVSAGGREVLAALPPPAAVLPVESLKPATRVLATLSTTDAPVIASMNYGGGQVFAIIGEGLWRWSMLPPRLEAYRGAFESFWCDAVRGLALGGEFQPGQDVSLKVARTALRLGDPQIVDVTLKRAPPEGFSPSLKLQGPDGKSHAVMLQSVPGVASRYTASFRPDSPGAWAAQLDAPPLSPAQQSRRFSVYDLDLERLRSDARPQVLRELAEGTGGEFFTADRQIDWPDRLQRQRVAQIAPSPPRYIWDRAWVMALLLGWMGIEWIARRKAGWV